MSLRTARERVAPKGGAGPGRRGSEPTRSGRFRGRPLASLAAALASLAACSSGNGGVNGLGTVPHDRWFKVTGSHQGFGCDACHDLTARSFTMAGLPGDKPGMTCLGCHAEAATTTGHAAVAGFVYGNPSCVSCHRDGTAALSPADHATFFPIAATDAHTGIGCVSCHGATSKVAASLQCAACHVEADAWHQPASLTAGYGAVASYARDGASCQGCHMNASVPAFTHVFAIQAGAAHGPQAMKCKDCHGATSPDLSQVACTSCHAHADQAATAALHGGVTGYVYASQSCATCHADGASALPAGHDANSFPVTLTKHATVACSSCHGADRTLAQVTCVPCHAQATMSTAHAAIPASTTGRRDGVAYQNYQWASLSCLRCHADGQVDRIAAHPTVNGGFNDDRHRPFCLTCHQAQRASGRTWSADFASFSCLACHTDNNGGGN